VLVLAHPHRGVLAVRKQQLVPSLFHHVGIFVLGGVALVAALFGIGAIGWHAALEFHKAVATLETLRTTATLTENKLLIENPRQEISSKGTALARANQKLERAHQMPTDRDWSVLSECMLKTLPGVEFELQQLSERLGRAPDATEVNQVLSETGLAVIVCSQDVFLDLCAIIGLRRELDRCVAQLEGAGMLGTKILDGTGYLVFNKNPSVGFNPKDYSIRYFAQ
jgi:hypothetical protein